ncbi:hypothetical protein HGA88_02915 [Candidatus Roizmanbacteria bacterium]|nr:hypothetical protein [Candidatus Roizmanbacteria bacterium]
MTEGHEGDGNHGIIDFPHKWIRPPDFKPPKIPLEEKMPINGGRTFIKDHAHFSLPATTEMPGTDIEIFCDTGNENRFDVTVFNDIDERDKNLTSVAAVYDKLGNLVLVDIIAINVDEEKKKMTPTFCFERNSNWNLTIEPTDRNQEPFIYSTADLKKPVGYAEAGCLTTITEVKPDLPDVFEVTAEIKRHDHAQKYKYSVLKYISPDELRMLIDPKVENNTAVSLSEKYFGMALVPLFDQQNNQ